MGNYTIFLKFENPRRGRQARNFSENDPKILDLKSSSEQIIFRKLSLGAPEKREERDIPGQGHAFLIKILAGKSPQGKDPGWILYFKI